MADAAKFDIDKNVSWSGFSALNLERLEFFMRTTGCVRFCLDRSFDHFDFSQLSTNFNEITHAAKS
jgi:hypothetical protein